MNSYNLNKNIKKIALTALAGVLIGTGVGTILYANIGGDTVTVFQDGLHSVLNISYGQASRIYNLALIIIAVICAREYFGSGTIISALIVGYLIDFSYNLLTMTNTNNNFVTAFIIFLIGQSIYSLGLSLLIGCKLGMNALDSVIYNILLTILGYLMGGVVGIGTIISIACTGLMIDTFTKIIKRGKK